MYSLVLFNLPVSQVSAIPCTLSFLFSFKGNGIQENSKGYSLKQGKAVCGVKLDPLTQAKVAF